MAIKKWFKISTKDIVIVIFIWFALGLLHIYFQTSGIDHYTTTRHNFEVLRTAIQAYYGKTGSFPSLNLAELYGPPKFYGKTIIRSPLSAIPPEMVLREDTRPAEMNPPNRRVHNQLNGQGGWFYEPTNGRVLVNWNQPLPTRWGQHAGENPSTW